MGRQTAVRDRTLGEGMWQREVSREFIVEDDDAVGVPFEFHGHPETHMHIAFDTEHP